MLEIIKKSRKILAMLIVAITLIATIQPVVLGVNDTISGSGSGDFIARQYATRIKTTDAVNGGEYGIIARRIIKRGWNFSDGDGVVVFCAQNGVPFATGEYYSGSYYIPTSEELKRASKIAYCGWYQERGTYGGNGVFDNASLKQYAFTQQMMWESLRTEFCNIC